MTLTLDLSPEVTSGLQRKAARLGVPLERYAAGVLRREAESDSNERTATGTATGAQARHAARRALEALAAGTRAGMPPIPDEALTSANLYAGRGEYVSGE